MTTFWRTIILDVVSTTVTDIQEAIRLGLEKQALAGPALLTQIVDRWRADSHAVTVHLAKPGGK